MDTSGQAKTEAAPFLVDCHHGSRPSAVVCRHVLGATGEPRRWIENKSDPGDTQGWCLACEEFFEAEGGMTEAFRTFNNFALVCDLCYLEIVAHHSQSGGADV